MFAKSSCIVGLIFVVLFGLVSSEEHSFSLDDAKSTIQKYIKTISGHSLNVTSTNLCDKYSCCELSSNQCNVDSFKRDSSTLILPGGLTQCIFSTSTPYAFQLIPGDSDKLLVYFQGGGACWDKASTEAGFCTTDVVPNSPVGVFDRSNINNHFRDYTIVHALYCSGDVWGGNVTRSYTAHDSSVIQHGIQNAQATVDWIVQQQQTGRLASTLTDLVVMGCSAGSIGAQLWGVPVLNALKWKSASIVPDSYAGIFPNGTQGPLVYDFGLCTWDKLPKSLLSNCLSQTLTLQQIQLEFQREYSHIPFGFLQSKTDSVQISFYISVAASFFVNPTITPSEFYNDVNQVFGDYNQHSPNFVTYLVDGSQHCFTCYNLLYTADGLGPNDNNGIENTGITMNNWLKQLPLETSNESVDTLCLGDIQTSKSSNHLNDNTYCSSAVVPKTFTN